MCSARVNAIQSLDRSRVCMLEKVIHRLHQGRSQLKRIWKMKMLVNRDIKSKICNNK